jgi:uncharacterized membrane protein
MRNRGNALILAVSTAIALWFLYGFAFNYLGADPGRFGIYVPRRQWLTIHILAGAAALLLGPLQFWLALNRRTAILHRVLGLCYVSAVFMSAIAAFYLAFHTDFGLVFGMGFSAMACAWLISTALATIAILRRLAQQHHEWMIRSYVVTFGFITFRALNMIFEVARVGKLVDRMTAASWLAWSVPLFITETVLQGRKVFARPVVSSAVPVPNASAYSTSPEQGAFGFHSSESTYLHRP